MLFMRLYESKKTAAERTAERVFIYSHQRGSLGNAPDLQYAKLPVWERRFDLRSYAFLFIMRDFSDLDAREWEPEKIEAS